MNSFKKLARTLALAACLGGATLAPTQDAKAGIIIGVAIPGIGSALAGLTITAAGFFWGIQSDDLNPWAAALFVLEQNADPAGFDQALMNRYPELDPALRGELARLVAEKAKTLPSDEQGLKEVILSQAEIAPVLEILAETGSPLAAQIERDLTQSSR
jgi:hypothetical protein